MVVQRGVGRLFFFRAKSGEHMDLIGTSSVLRVGRDIQRLWIATAGARKAAGLRLCRAVPQLGFARQER